MSDRPSHDPSPLHSQLAHLQADLAALQARVQSLEAQIERAEPQEAAQTVPAPTAPRLPPPPPRAPILNMPPAGPPTPATAMPPERGFPPAPAHGARVAEYVARHVSAAPPPKKPTQTLEARLGLTVAAWIGGAVLFAGVLFFLKYAWDQGWLWISPTARFLLTLGFGAALVALGQFIFHRKFRILAAVLLAAGVAVSMAALWAGFIFFTPPVINSTVAFLGVFAVGIAGVLMGWQTRQLVLPILALLGMYASPLVLNTGEDHSLALLLYLLVVTLMALTLSFLKRKWWIVRIEAFGLAWLWLGAWTIDGPVHAHEQLAIAALTVAFIVFLVESVAAIHRAYGMPEAEVPPTSPNTRRLEGSLAIVSLLNTMLAAVFLAVAFQRLGLEHYWVVPLGLAGALALVMGVTPSRSFSAACRIQTIALIALAVPLYFDYAAIAFAWGILALTFAAYAFARNSFFARIWALIFAGLTLGHVFTYEAFSDARLHTLLFSLGDIHVDGWLLLAWGSAIHALLTGWLCSVSFDSLVANADAAPHTQDRALGFDHWAGITGVVLATAAWIIASAAKVPVLEPLTLWLLLWTCLCVTLARMLRSRTLAQLSLVLLAALAIKWMLFDAMLAATIRSEMGLPPGSLVPLANLFTLNAAIIVVLLLLCRNNSLTYALKAWWIGLIAFGLINIEALRIVDRLAVAEPWIVKNVVLSVLWGLIGLGAVMVGFWRKLPAVRYVALALLGITVGKVLLIDMADVNTFTRVLSFLALGIMLLLVSFTYHRVYVQRPGSSA